MSNEVKEPKISDLLRQLSDLLREGREDEAKRLLTRQEALLTARDDSNRGAEHYAAVGGCLQIFQYACNMNSGAVDCPDELGWTPLMIACSAGRTALVRHLLSLPQVNVNAKNKNGQSPLHYAASKNYREIVHLLIESGADINSSDKYQSTPLHRAASQGHEQIVHMMLAQPKIRVDMRDGEGNTPLYVACEENREDVALSLVLKGAQLEIENRDKKTPLSVVQTSALRTKLKKAEERANKMEQ